MLTRTHLLGQQTPAKGTAAEGMPTEGMPAEGTAPEGTAAEGTAAGLGGTSSLQQALTMSGFLPVLDFQALFPQLPADVCPKCLSPQASLGSDVLLKGQELRAGGPPAQLSSLCSLGRLLINCLFPDPLHPRECFSSEFCF